MKLKWSLVTRHIRPHEQMRSKLRQKIQKMEKHLEHFPPDAVYLQVSLVRHPKKEWFTAGLNLRLPSNILHAQKSGEDPIPVFDQAVKALLREVAVLKSALRREDQWENTPRRRAYAEAQPLRFAEARAAAW